MLSNRISESDFLLFNRQLVSLIETNLPLSKGLAMLSKEARKPALQRAIQDLQKSVEAGQSLSKAVANRADAFPKLYAKIIEAGEESNNLVGVLSQFVKYSETMSEMKQRLKDVLMYPAFVLVAALVLGVAFILFVLPGMSESATNLLGEAVAEGLSGSDGPLGVRGLLSAAHYLPFIAIGLFGLLVLVTVVCLALRATEGGRGVLDGIKLRIPFYGACYRLSLLTRFSETLGLLLQSNVPLGDALYLTGQCSASPTVTGACARAQRAVENGQKLSDAVGSEPLFGPMLTFMASIGEKREAPHEELYSAAAIFASNLHNRARRAALWIDGIVLVIMALLVVFFSRLVFQPILYLIRSMSEM